MIHVQQRSPQQAKLYPFLEKRQKLILKGTKAFWTWKYKVHNFLLTKPHKSKQKS